MKEFSDSDSDVETPSYRRAHFNRTVRALFKKSFLIKTRRPMSIVEFCIATVLWVVLYPCYEIAGENLKSNKDPPLISNDTLPSPICYYFTTQMSATFSIAPDCNNTRTLVDLINRTMIASLVSLAAQASNQTSNTTNSSTTSNSALYTIKSRLTKEMNDFVDKYTDNIIQSISEDFQAYKNIDLSNSDFENYVKMTIIEGIVSFYKGSRNQFDFQNFVITNIFKYFDSFVTLQNIRKVRQALAKNQGTIPFLDKSYYLKYSSNFQQKMNTIMNNKYKKGYTSRLLDKFTNNIQSLASDSTFPSLLDTDFNISDFDENTTAEILSKYYVFNPIFVDNADQVKDEIYNRDANGLGVYWVNAEDENATLSPEIQSFYQNLDDDPSEYFFNLLIREVSYMNGQKGFEFSFSNDSYQSYAYPKSRVHYDISILVAVVVVFPIIIASMCDLQILLEEKDNHVMALSFLMGCSETAYFIVGFCMQFVSSIFGYVLMCIFYCYVFIFKGTSFTLMLVISILFILSHIAFMMFLTTFMKKARMGRMITVLFLIISIFFAFVHYFYTLDESNHSNVAKHIFSIIPLSSYQMAMISMFKESLEKMPPVDWSMLKNNSHVNLVYQMWFALMWLSVDFVFYFLLFLLFNLTNPRDFGSPLMRWKDLFSRKAWRRLFSRQKILALRKKGTSVLYDTNTKLFDNELIKVEELSKVYHSHHTVRALSNVNFTINQNEVIVVIGPNGAGKSTLINILSGALQPTTGKLSLYRQPPTESFNEIRTILGVCFQDNVIIENLSIEENLQLFGAFRNISKDELKQTMSFFAETLQLKDMMKTRTGDLSGGQKRKVCIAMSLLGNPPLVIMDEPTAGVDVQARQLIWKFIAQLRNTTTIITSHALEEAEAVSSRLFVVAGGTLPFAGTSTEFRKTFKCGYLLRVEAVGENDGPITQFGGQADPSNSSNSVMFVENGESHIAENPELKKKQMSSAVINLSDSGDIERSRKKLFRRRRKKKKSEALNKLFESVYADSDSGSPDDEERQQTADELAALRVLEMAREFDPKAKMSRERTDSIWLPVSPLVQKIVNELEARKLEFGVKSYSISIEQLEDVLLKLIMSEETTFNPTSNQE